MKKLKKLFTEENLTWTKLIIFSVICGVITGIIPLVRSFGRTSIHNIAECFEMWILLAMFIILKSKKPLEAALKTFVFFLISQPLCYLVQVPFSSLGFHIFMYYPHWFKLTLLTLPGAFVVWYAKKENILSMLILTVVNVALLLEGYHHFGQLIKSFPYQLLAVLFIISQLIFYTAIIFKDKKKKTMLYVTIAIILIGILGFRYLNIDFGSNRGLLHEAALVPTKGETYTLVEKDESIDVVIDEDMIIAKGKDPGTYIIKIKDSKENIVELSFVVYDSYSELSEANENNE